MVGDYSKPIADVEVLLLEGISETAVEELRRAGFEKITRLKTALDAAELEENLQNTSFLGIRSRTKLEASIFDKFRKLTCVGCFSVGTNQVNLDAASKAGVPVFNAPFSNTRSVAELTIAEIVMLSRGIFEKSLAAHSGIWKKSAVGSHEVRGKILGIVGYGNIGSQVAVLAENLGMRVIYYDILDKLSHGNVEQIDGLTDLLVWSDFVTLHVPDTPQTRGMIGKEQISMMKPGSFLINNARGKVVDLDALAGALKSGQIGGAAIDVFPVEPGSNAEQFECQLQRINNVILTPHIAGSTNEAQSRIGVEVARKFADYKLLGSTEGAVNFPSVNLPLNKAHKRFLHVHENTPGQLKYFNDLFAVHEVNISAQQLQTFGDIGYIIADADVSDEKALKIVEELDALEGTIKIRYIN